MTKTVNVFKTIAKGDRFRFVTGDDTTTVFVKRTLKTYVPADDPQDVRSIATTFAHVHLDGTEAS